MPPVYRAVPVSGLSSATHGYDHFVPVPSTGNSEEREEAGKFRSASGYDYVLVDPVPGYQHNAAWSLRGRPVGVAILGVSDVLVGFVGPSSKQAAAVAEFFGITPRMDMNSKKRTSRRSTYMNPPRAAAADPVGARELLLATENESSLYPQHQAIAASLLRKMKSGRYDHAMAPKAWQYWLDSGAKLYSKQFGGSFSPATRTMAAREYADQWLNEMRVQGLAKNAKRTSRNPDTKLYSVIDRMTGFERRHLTREQAQMTLEAHKERCARHGFREETKVFYRDGTDVTREFRGGSMGRNAKRTSRNPRLTESQRSRLPLSVFVFPERRAFPLESKAAAYDAIRMLRLGRVKSASDFKEVADAIRAKYPAVWMQYGTALSWPKVKAAKALGSKRRAATVAAKKRVSKRTSRKVAANKRGSR